MKKILILILLVSCSSRQKPIGNIDNSKKAIGKVTYIYLSKERKYKIERESYLFFNETYSSFKHSFGDDPMVEVNGPEGQDGYVQDKVGNVTYKDFTKKELKLREIVIFQPYLSKESLPVIKWEILQDRKKIGRFNTRKAQTSFRGRDYTVWFTEQIPISDGPWKFHGLPGLILEVTESRNEYGFFYKSIEIPTKKDYSLDFIDDGKYLPFDAFINAQDIEFEKLKKQTQAEWDGEGELKVTKPLYNPIELVYD